MSPNTPSDIPYPSSAWAAAPAGTAGLEGDHSTFAAGAEGRRIAWAGLDYIGLVGDRSCFYMAMLVCDLWMDGCGGGGETLPLLRVLRSLATLVVTLRRHVWLMDVTELCRSGCDKRTKEARRLGKSR
jgi:hypothetical protein